MILSTHSDIVSSCWKILLTFLKRHHLEGIGSILITLLDRQNKWESDLCWHNILVTQMMTLCCWAHLKGPEWINLSQTSTYKYICFPLSNWDSASIGNSEFLQERNQTFDSFWRPKWDKQTPKAAEEPKQPTAAYKGNTYNSATLRGM